MILNVKAVCAFVSLFGLSIFASDYKKPTEQEVANLRQYLKENLNSRSYSDGKRATIAKPADVPVGKDDKNERASGGYKGYCCYCCWKMSQM